MKRAFLIGLMCSILLPSALKAAPQNDCMYHPLQEIIRSARSEKDIEPWIKDGVNFNMNFRCGGSILELAVIRGNPQVLQLLLEKAKINPTAMIPNSAFPIKGAPKMIPISFFAAYYAPRADILNLFIHHSGDTIYQKDANGQDILWYIEQNPVLRKTELADMLIRNLLIEDTNEFNQKEHEEKQKELQKRRQIQQKELVKTKVQQNAKKQPVEQKEKQNNSHKKVSNIIEDNIGNDFNPTDNNQAEGIPLSDFNM